MAGPWDKYRTAAEPASGAPWKAYQGTGAAPSAVGADAQPAAPASSSEPRKGRSGAKAEPASDVEFISGNLARGFMNLGGLPADTLENALNLGAAGVHAFRSATPGGRDPGVYYPPFRDSPFTSNWIQHQAERAGVTVPEPQSGAGRYAAAALRGAPTALAGRPTAIQVPKAIGAGATSGLGAELATDVYGPEAAPLGAMLPSARGLAKPPTAGERATSERQARAFDKSREMGIPVPPKELRTDKPQQRVQDTANKDLRMPEGTDIADPKIRRNYKNAYWQDYEAVMNDPALKGGVMPNQRFQNEVQAIGAEIEAGRASLPETYKSMAPVLKLLGEYGYAAMPPGVKGPIQTPPRQQPIPPKVAMNAVRRLREDASTNLSSESAKDKNIGAAQKRLANALENLVEDNLGATGSPLMDKFRTARTQIAKMHDYEEAMDPVTGKIVPARLAAIQNESGKLTGGAADLAEVSRQFPISSSPIIRQPSDEMVTKKVTPMAFKEPAALGAHWASRLVSPITMSSPYQDYILNPRTRLSPEAQRALRFTAAGEAAQDKPDWLLPPPRQDDDLVIEAPKKKKDKRAMRAKDAPMIGVRG